MVLQKCGMAEKVVRGCKKRGVDVISYSDCAAKWLCRNKR